MQGLKESCKICADQIVSRPLLNIAKYDLPPGRVNISYVNPRAAHAKYSHPITSTNYNQGQLKYNGLGKNSIRNDSGRNSQSIPKRNIFQEAPQEKKPLPKLLYIQNPLVWLSNKIDFRFLRYSWDPTFSEEEFTKGTRQAISTVTHMVSKNMFESMKPLFTKTALLNLRRDVEILWADEVRRNIGLNPEDVQLIIPRKIYFRHTNEPILLGIQRGMNPSSIALLTPKKATNLDKKFCDIDVLFIGMKWLEEQRINNPLVFVDIVSRFHRNYSEGMAPDWTISAFKVRRFSLIPQKT